MKGFFRIYFFPSLGGIIGAGIGGAVYAGIGFLINYLFLSENASRFVGQTIIVGIIMGFAAGFWIIRKLINKKIIERFPIENSDNDPYIGKVYNIHEEKVTIYKKETIHPGYEKEPQTLYFGYCIRENVQCQKGPYEKKYISAYHKLYYPDPK